MHHAQCASIQLFQTAQRRKSRHKNLRSTVCLCSYGRSALATSPPLSFLFVGVPQLLQLLRHAAICWPVTARNMRPIAIAQCTAATPAKPRSKTPVKMASSARSSARRPCEPRRATCRKWRDVKALRCRICISRVYVCYVGYQGTVRDFVLETALQSQPASFLGS